MTYCPTWLIMSDWSWVTFWDTQDPVENVRKQSWNSEQNNAEINFGPIQIFITQIEILRRLLFPNPPFLPKSLWSSTHLCAVLSPWTRAPTFGSIPTREGEGQEHPEQAGEWHEDGFSTWMCLILPQAKNSASLSAWQHIYMAPGSCVTPPPDRKWGLSCS